MHQLSITITIFGHAAQLNATEIMIVNGYQSDGSFEAYRPDIVSRSIGGSLIIREQPLRTVLLVRSLTFQYTSRFGASNVTYDTITSQGGELYINFHYGNNHLRFMSGKFGSSVGISRDKR